MRNIRATFNIAIKSKIAKQELYPFKDYKISALKSQKIKKALTKEQLQNLIDFDIKKLIERVEKELEHVKICHILYVRMQPPCSPITEPSI